MLGNRIALRNAGHEAKLLRSPQSTSAELPLLVIMNNHINTFSETSVYRKVVKAFLLTGLFAAPAIAAPCPATPGNLPDGRARWSEKGDQRWLLTTSDKKSYPCLPPTERKEMNKDGIYTDYEHIDFICAPLKVTISKCVKDAGRSYFPRYGIGKDFYTALCELGGSRWQYQLVDKNGETFSLFGFPDFSRWTPNAIEKKCPNTHTMEERGAWVFKSGEKYIYINRIQNYLATPVKQPSI
jgi:hypothetical protein